MFLDKTDKARQALRDGVSAGLGLRARRILILTDGKRSFADLKALLGPDIEPTIDVLLREGYLADRSARAGATGPATGALSATRPATRSATPPEAAPAATPAAPRPAAPARRSLAASKMYLLDMLQLQRTPEAAELLVTIQCTTDPSALIDALLHAVRELLQAGNASYGPRIAARLSETLPEPALPRLEAIRSEYAGPRRLSSVA